MVMCLVVGASLHIRRLNLQHGRRRVALGKSAVVVDMSLESAEEVERMETMENSQHQGRAREIADNEAGNPSGGDALEEDGHGNQQCDKAFGDVTDLENEDFLFVF